VWKEAHVKKHGQVAFRTKLKAQFSGDSPLKSNTAKRQAASGDIPVVSSEDAAKNRKRRREILNY